MAEEEGYPMGALRSVMIFFFNGSVTPLDLEIPGTNVIPDSSPPHCEFKICLSHCTIFTLIVNRILDFIEGMQTLDQGRASVVEGFSEDGYEMYYEIWKQFDPEGTHYIRYDQLSDFLDGLEPPLQVLKPNKYKIVTLEIPICKGDRMLCLDILDALTKDFFARKGNPVEETAVFWGEGPGRAHKVEYEPISSTLLRQREEYCARLIQNAWRKHKQ